MKKKKITILICLIIWLPIFLIKGFAYLDLCNAIAQENPSRVEFLLKIGFDPNKRDLNGNPPLHLAAINGNDKIAQVLINSGANVNALDDLGSTAIEAATSFGHLNVLELLVKNKSTIDPLLVFSASLNGHSDIVEFLLNNGLNSNQATPQGKTPLHNVSFGDHVETAKVLLANGAQLNAQDKEGFTPLHSAAFYGAEKVVKLLVESGANLNVKDNNGLTPFEVAQTNSHTLVEEILKTANGT